MPTPPITDPLLLDRLTMDDEAFMAFLLEAVTAVGRRPFTEADYERAAGYPWDRPGASCLIEDERARLLADLPADERAAALAEGSGPGRFPLLAFGSNTSPQTLARKFAHLPAPDRRLLAVSGRLHGFDVGAAAHPTGYGALPATIFPSDGTAVQAAVLWVNEAQFTQLAWSEVSYRLGRLDGARFAADDGLPGVDGVWAFVSRFGAFAPDGEPVAMAAVPARGRTAPARTQAELLGAAARLGLGPPAGPRDLVRAVFEDFAAFAVGAGARVRAAHRPWDGGRWRPFPD